jgi:hypothetical protein
MSERAQATRQALAEIVDEDARAFSGVMQAMRMPRATEAERHAREQALQGAYRRAAEVPLQARAVARRTRACPPRRAKGPCRCRLGCRHRRADGARSGRRRRAQRPRLNLQTLEDDTFARECRGEVDRMRGLARRTAMRFSTRYASVSTAVGSRR